MSMSSWWFVLRHFVIYWKWRKQERIMKRYLLFAGDTYYPAGGLGDLIDKFDTVEEARQDALKARYFEDGSGTWYFDWYQIVDANTLTIVEHHQRGSEGGVT